MRERSVDANPSTDRTGQQRRPGVEITHARALGALSVAGGMVALATLALGVDESVNVHLLAGLAAGALLLGFVSIAAAKRLPRAWLPASLTALVLVTSAGVLGSGEADTPYIFFYVWIVVMAWYFLRPPVAAALTAFAVVSSGASMAIVATPIDNADTWWLLVSSTMIAVSALSAVLRLRADSLVARLEQAAIHDPLSGLLNRAGFEQRSDVELARARRHDTPLAVVVADIDGFKGLNDDFGHRAGDAALRVFADLCRASTRPEDLVARIGGEEFALVLPDTDEADALAAAERLRAAVRTQLKAPDGRPVTASFGVAVFPAHAGDIDVLLHLADSAMYRAKTRGRDRTVAYEPARRAYRP